MTSAIQAPASIRKPWSSVKTGTRGLEILAPTTPMMSSASNTPPVLKPKRSRGSGTTKPKSSQEPGLDAAGPKSRVNRVPTTAEHIIRERQRRDDMSAKYAILGSLLPPAPKRKRVVVVEDAISFVGALQQKKAQLLNRRADLKLMASYNQSAWCKRRRSLAPLRGPLISSCCQPFSIHLSLRSSGRRLRIVSPNLPCQLPQMASWCERSFNCHQCWHRKRHPHVCM